MEEQWNHDEAAALLFAFRLCGNVQLEDTRINIASKQNSHHQIHKIECSRFTVPAFITSCITCIPRYCFENRFSFMVKVETITAAVEYFPIFCCIIYCLCILVSNSIWSICGAHMLRWNIFHLLWTLNIANRKLNTVDKN